MGEDGRPVSLQPQSERSSIHPARANERYVFRDDAIPIAGSHELERRMVEVPRGNNQPTTRPNEFLAPFKEGGRTVNVLDHIKCGYTIHSFRAVRQRAKIVAQYFYALLSRPLPRARMYFDSTQPVALS